MTNQQPEADSGRPENPPVPNVAQTAGATAPANLDSTGRDRNGTGRKARRRSVYLFPAYGFSMALDIARQVEESGGGTLTEETLAVNLGLSKTSSGFRLKCLAARQFNLLNKQGPTVSTTSIAKAILKPTSNEDALRGYRQSFLSIPLFQAVAERYRGQRLPESQTLRNVLEREFMVEHKRVQQAERLLLDSARDTYLLKHRGDGTYLTISESPLGPLDEPGFLMDTDSEATGETLAQPSVLNGALGASLPSLDSLSPTNTITFSLDEIGQLREDDFETVWRAFGILVKARAARSKSAYEFNVEEG